MAMEWTLRYDGECHYCKKSLKKGKKAFRDEDTGILICGSCEKSLKAGIELVVQSSPAQKLVDRAHAIRNLGTMASPEAQAELQELIKKLRTDFSADRVARKFLTEVFELRRHASLISMCLKFTGHCTSCGIVVPAGSMGLWEKQARRIWCLDCAGDLK